MRLWLSVLTRVLGAPCLQVAPFDQLQEIERLVDVPPKGSSPSPPTPTPSPTSPPTTRGTDGPKEAAGAQAGAGVQATGSPAAAILAHAKSLKEEKLSNI